MTSATLYREGPDLDELLADLDAEHGRVRVLEVNYGRDGGVMGFFARRLVGVHYVVDEEGWLDEAPLDTVELSTVELSTSLAAPPAAAAPFPASHRFAAPEPTTSGEELARQAAEMVEFGRVPDAMSNHTDNVEFARLLLDLAAQKRAATAESPVPAPESAPVPAPPAALVPAPVLVPEPAQSGLDRDARLDHEAQATRAALLARARTRPVGAHRAAAEPETPVFPAVSSPPAVTPAPAPTPPVASPVTAATVTRTPFTLRRQLVEIGVPVDWIPDDANAYQVVEQLVGRLRTAGEAEPAPGEVYAVVGPTTLAQAEARRLCARLRLDPAEVRTAGCGVDPISHARQAAALARRHRGESDTALVVVVATDATVGDDPGGCRDHEWAAGIVSALAPDRTLAVLDAACRPADARELLARFDSHCTLAVVGAARTTSPAALWELDVPIAFLDGRPASRGAWVALLLDRLADLDAREA